jgi:hypothetical protein
MNSIDKAVVTQLANMEKRTGKSLQQLAEIVRASGLAHNVRNLDAAATGEAGPATPDDAVAALYAGKKADLKLIHDRLMQQLRRFGEFEVAPKKTYVSLRRKKQFAMIGPATNTQVEVGLNMKGMCDYKVRLASVDEVDAELVRWLRTAFDAAG